MCLILYVLIFYVPHQFHNKIRRKTITLKNGGGGWGVGRVIMDWDELGQRKRRLTLR